MAAISDREFADISSRSVERLLDCIQVLEAFSVSTEDEFLYIGSKLKDFNDRAASISDLFSSAVSLMSESEAGDDPGDALEWLNHLIEINAGPQGTDSLDIREQLSSRIVLLIPEYSETLRKNINTIITSLQLHDITRQQFEKSRTAFHVILESLEEESDRSGSSVTAGESGPQGMLSSLLRFSIAEAALVRGTRNDFLSAVNTVIDSLTSISSDILNMLGEVSSISEHENSGCSGLLSGGIGSLLAEIKETGQALSDEIADVVRTISIHTSVDLLVERLLSSLQDIIADVKNADADLQEPEELGPDLTPPAPGEIPDGEKKTGEFGDNVELF